MVFAVVAHSGADLVTYECFHIPELQSGKHLWHQKFHYLEGPICTRLASLPTLQSPKLCSQPLSFWQHVQTIPFLTHRVTGVACP